MRAATHADIDACVALLEQLFEIERDFSPERMRQARGLQQLLDTKGNLLLVADDGTGVVGMVSVQRLISTAEGAPVGLVEDVVVDVDRRGRGIGTALLDAAEDWARTHGLARLQLLVDQANRRALRFYDRRGWSVTRLVARRQLLR